MCIAINHMNEVRSHNSHIYFYNVGIGVLTNKELTDRHFLFPYKLC